MRSDNTISWLEQGHFVGNLKRGDMRLTFVAPSCNTFLVRSCEIDGTRSLWFVALLKLYLGTIRVEYLPLPWWRSGSFRSDSPGLSE